MSKISRQTSMQNYELQWRSTIISYFSLSWSPNNQHASVNKNIITLNSSGQKTKVKSEPLKYINNLIKDFNIKIPKQLPSMASMLVGYFSYDVIRYIEKIPNKCKDDLNERDLYLIQNLVNKNVVKKQAELKANIRELEESIAALKSAKSTKILESVKPSKSAEVGEPSKVLKFVKPAKEDEAKEPNNSVYNGLEWSEFGRVKSSLSKLKIGNVYFSLLHEKVHGGKAKYSKTINVDSTFIRVKSTYHQLLSASECIADGGRAVWAWLNIERIMGHLSKVTCRFFPVRIILIHASLAWSLFWSKYRVLLKIYPRKRSFYLTCSDE